MSNQPIIYTQSGYVKICSVFEFIRTVKREEMSKTIKEFSTVRRNFYQYNLNRYYSPDHDISEVYSKTWHILKQNPASLLVELKKTTTLKERKKKNIDLEELLHELVGESSIEDGLPTHLFPIGSHRYALVCEDDVRLFTKDDFSQSLVCLVPKRNFTIYAPHLKVAGQ